VVSIPDDYSGELPFAYVVLLPHAAARIRGDPNAAQDVKQALFKVRILPYIADQLNEHLHSTWPMRKPSTSG
jgi:hypothetical protein